MEKTRHQPLPAAPADPAASLSAQLRASVTKVEGGVGAHLVVSDLSGQYIGMLTYHVKDPAAISLLAIKFAEWIGMESNRVQVVGAAAKVNGAG